MAVLNLRNVPEELMVRLRVAAAARGAKLHAFCLEMLEQGAATEGLFREVQVRAGITDLPDEAPIYGGVRGGGMTASLEMPKKPSAFEVDIT